MSAEPQRPPGGDVPGEAGPPARGPVSRIPEGWVEMPVEHLPAPTYWPSGLALAITFLFWSLITSWVITVVGAIMFIVSLSGWIQDIRHERAHHTRSH